MSDFNITEMMKETELKQLEKVFEKEGLWEKKKEQILSYGSLLRKNLIISRDTSEVIFYRNDMFLNIMKKLMIQNPEEFKIKRDVEHMFKYNYELNSLSKGRYDSSSKEFYEKLLVNNMSDIRKRGDLFTFSGLFLLIMIQDKSIFPAYFADYKLKDLQEKINNKDIYWASNLRATTNVNLDDTHENNKNINKLKEHFYEFAEIEGVCPFELTLTVLNEFLKYGKEILRYENNFFEVIFDDCLLSSLPKIKEEKPHVYEDLLDNMMYLIYLKNISQDKTYLSKMEDYNEPIKEYRIKNGDYARFEDFLGKIPLKEILKIKVRNNFNEAEGLADWTEGLGRYLRQIELTDKLQSLDIQEKKDKQKKKL